MYIHNMYIYIFTYQRDQGYMPYQSIEQHAAKH